MGNAACPKRLDIYWVRRPRRSRSRTGCDSCRARRRKCDEERPICGFCRTYNLQCTRAAPPPKKGLSAAVVPTSPSEVAISITEQQVQGAQELPPVEAHISRPLNASQRGTPGLGATNGPSETFAPAWHPSAEFFGADEASPSLADLQDLQQHLFESGILLDHASPGSSSGTSEDIVASKGPNATMLFNHFCYKTIPWLLYSDRHDSLILQHIVPQAITDPLVLLTLLAVSGIHLRQLQPSIEAEALEYYASALSHLNGILSDRLRSQRTGYRSLLTTLILLCHYEVSQFLSPSPECQGLKVEPLQFVDGNTYGAALQHIRACHEFIHIALKDLKDPEHQQLVVLLVESYGYFALLSNIRGSADEDSIRLGLEFSTSILPLIKDLPTFGAMFTFEPECLSMAPLIAQMSRYEDNEAAESRDECYQSLYQTLRKNVRVSELWRAGPGSLNDEPVEEVTTQLVKHIKTIALLLFLQNTYYRHCKSPTEAREILQPLVDRAVTLLMRLEATGECYGLLWCLLVVGSLVHEKDDQQVLARKFETIQSTMPSKLKGLKLLRWLWDDPDGMEVGLTGLDKVAIAHGVTSFIC